MLNVDRTSRIVNEINIGQQRVILTFFFNDHVVDNDACGNDFIELFFTTGFCRILQNMEAGMQYTKADTIPARL